METLHSLKLVVLRTGLSPQLIRVWEKRYQAVTPIRTPTNRRLYTDNDIARLDVLHQLTQTGHGISQIANLPTDRLAELLAKAGHVPSVNPQVPSPANAEDFLKEALATIQNLDAPGLEQVMQRGLLHFGFSRALQEVARLIEVVGDRWRTGELRIAHEHLATATIRIFLSDFIRPARFPVHTPLLTVATPAEQHHDLGAVLTAAAAHNNGWRVTFLGASLPYEEIAGAAIAKGARAVALSIVYPADDPNLERELESLRKILPAPIAIIVGGRAAPAYRPVLDRINARIVTSLPVLYQTLDELRRQ